VVSSSFDYYENVNHGMTIGKMIGERVERARRTWARPSWWNLLIVLPWAIGAVWCVYEWNTDRAIAGRQQTTKGIITAHEPANHNQYVYVFSVNGKSYTGRQSPKKQALEVGKRVVVYYDPFVPAKNALTDFSELSAESLGPLPLLLIGVGAVAVFIYRRRRRDRATSGSAG
jgi:hypothetical protein